MNNTKLRGANFILQVSDAGECIRTASGSLRIKLHNCTGILVPQAMVAVDGSGTGAPALDELFVSFEEKPQGAASLAQVHRAVLANGTTVAVKVQHPKVQAQSSKDIMVMEFLLQVVHWLFPDFAFLWLVEEAKRNMPLELDFLNEGRNAEKVSHMLKHFDFLKVPKIHWDLSTRRVLTMDFVDGGQVNDREYMRDHRIDVNE
ncbi:aarF domain-containing protein kinase 1 isoform X1, partial [Tachysurus ichikawai]